MYAQLGDIQFEGLKGFDSFSGTRSTNFAEHSKIESKPRLQRVGTNLEEIRIGVRFHASFCNPEVELAALDTKRENAEVLPLILGNGSYEGDFVIVAIERTKEIDDKQGNIISLVCNLSLKEVYNPDRLRSRRVAAQSAAFAAGSSVGATVRVVLPPKPSIGKAVGLDVNTVRMAGATVANAVARAAVVPSERPSLSSLITTNLSTIEGSLSGLQGRLLDPVLAALQGNMPAAITAVFTSVQNLRAVLPMDRGSTNIALRSEEFDNAIWVKLNATITANATVAPDGTTTADKFLDNTTNGVHGATQTLSGMADNRLYVFSAYVKAAELSWMRLFSQSKAGTQLNTWFNLATGLKGTQQHTDSSITPVGNGWYRVAVVFSTNSGAGAVSVAIRTAAGANGGAYVGTGSQGIFIWGAQVEEGGTPTTYMRTTSASVTNNINSVVTLNTAMQTAIQGLKTASNQINSNIISRRI